MTVVGGGHSDHCIWPNVVAVDMGAFDQKHVVAAGEDGVHIESTSGPFVVAGAGCKTGDIIRNALEAGLQCP
jgi:hypothetical protein